MSRARGLPAGPALVVMTAIAGCTRGPEDAPPHPALERCDAGAPTRTASGDTDPPATATTSDPLPLPSGAPRLPYSDEDEPDSSGTTHVRTKLDPRAAYALDPKTMITMQRTACFGACPVYTVGLTGDGRVHFYGEENTTTRGYASSRVGQGAVAALLGFLEKRRFLSLHSQYLPRGSDSPAAIVFLRHGTGFKSFRHDLSNHTEPTLAAIEAEIDRVAGTAAWVGKRAPGDGKRRADEARPIPSRAMRQMTGAGLGAIERKCGATLHSKVTFELRLAVDALGYGRPAAGSIVKGTLGGGDGNDRDDPVTALTTCVDAAASQLVFPIAGVPIESTVRLELGT